MPLHCCAWIEQHWHLQKVLRLCHETKVGENRPVVATMAIFKGLVLADGHWAVGVVFDHDAIGVRRALVLFVYVGEAALLTLVRRHESDFALSVPREGVKLAPCQVQLVELLKHHW